MQFADQDIIVIARTLENAKTISAYAVCADYPQ